MAASDDDRVELTELDVITRYSLAVRTATADRAELIAAMRADLAWLEAGRTRRRSAPSASPRTAAPAATKKAAPVRSSAKSSTGKKATPARSRSTRSR